MIKSSNASHTATYTAVGWPHFNNASSANPISVANTQFNRDSLSVSPTTKHSRIKFYIPKPLAATSVATKIGALPLRNSCNT